MSAYIGQVFTRLTIIDRAPSDAKRNPRWLCRCECGTEKVIYEQSLYARMTLSCGCLHKEITRAMNTTHGLSASPEHTSWSGMLERCNNPNNKRYADYGGRGITVCGRWLSFENFFADMGTKPSLIHSIDRKDNDKGYSPDNCRWATPTQQQRNRRTNHVIEFNGERRSLVEWAEVRGLKPATLFARIKRGWSVERALRIGVN